LDRGAAEGREQFLAGGGEIGLGGREDDAGTAHDQAPEEIRGRPASGPGHRPAGLPAPASGAGFGCPSTGPLQPPSAASRQPPDRLPKQSRWSRGPRLPGNGGSSAPTMLATPAPGSGIPRTVTMPAGNAPRPRIGRGAGPGYRAFAQASENPGDRTLEQMLD